MNTLNPLPSWLPPGGTNRFQEVKATRLAAEASGVRLVNLGVGQPLGAPLLVARQAIAEAVMSTRQDMHEYMDNGDAGCPGFSVAFVQAYCERELSNVPLGQIDFCPIPGIKPTFMYVVLACGASDQHRINVVTCTNPGYPTPADVCRYLNPIVSLQEPELLPENGFRFTLADVDHLKAGFFSLWKTPATAFGQKVEGARHFNDLMIKPLEGSGVIGVHFPPYIRYAVCADIEPQADLIRATFKLASVKY